MSCKSTLNEFCQKRWKAAPCYITTRSGGEPHAPYWQSVCTLPDASTFLVSGIAGTRKICEEAAAFKALQALTILVKTTTMPSLARSMPTSLDDENDTKKDNRRNNNENAAIVDQNALAVSASSLKDGLFVDRCAIDVQNDAQPRTHHVFVDCDNIAFCDAALCSRFPHAQFYFYVSFQRNMPFVDNAVRLCQNTEKRPALHNGSDVCDVMILFDVFALVDAWKREQGYHSELQGRALQETGEFRGASPQERHENNANVIIVSGDKLLYNAQLLLAPHVTFLGSVTALTSILSHVDRK